ncbi:MAG TPA: rhomboid family intramembrane serine protease [Candidatus Limnocylindrales bacterium]|nr:rhomboid family intramembrane serine protease [Candidatus Limnocylindrales bacterium]
MSGATADHDLPSAGRLDRSTAIRLVEEGDALAAQGEYAEAARRYSRVIGHGDADIHVAALLGLAEARYRLDDEPGALQAWIAAAQAPETPLSWLAWKQLAGARVREGNLVGAMRAYREAERRAPLSERAEIAARLGWLAKESGDRRAASGYFARARAGGLAAPLVTWSIIALTVGIGLTEILSPDGSLFLSLFALDKAAVAQGELYRLVSVVLVHSPSFVLHLAGNMYALYLVGPWVEGLYGRAAYLAIYVLAAAAGSTASYVFTPNDSVGASGAIFGLFGCLFVALRVHRPQALRNVRGLASQIGILIVFNLALGFGLGRFIDNAAHIGGLVAGAWLGLAIRPRGMPTSSRLWQNTRPGGARSAPGGGPESRFAPTTELLVSLIAILLLVAVIGLGVAYGTATFEGRAAG